MYFVVQVGHTYIGLRRRYCLSHSVGRITLRHRQLPKALSTLATIVAEFGDSRRSGMVRRPVISAKVGLFRHHFRVCEKKCEKTCYCY